MVSNGMDVAVMEHHVASSGGGLTNPSSQARISYYGISGIPNSYFDGTISVLGGGTGTYNAFVNAYNTRKAIESDFTVAINGFNSGSDYTVLMSMENVEPNTSSSLVAHLAVTESGCVSGSVYNYVTRLFVPSANGTPVDFSSTPNQSVLLEFSLDPSWVVDNCEFVAFIQDNSTKEILQATNVAVVDLMPMYYNNASSQAIHMVPVENCAGEVAPQVIIANEGADALTSVDINYQVNDEDLNTFSWTGSLGYGETAAVDLPATAFDILADNDLVIYTTNPNGSDDEDNSNDTIASVFSSASEVVPSIHLYLKLDDNPEETSWELKNSAGDVIYFGGSYTDPQAFIQETLAINVDDCYTFIIYDEAGDGLADPGFYALRQSDYSLFYENENFEGTEELVQFSVNQTSVPTINEADGFAVYPNPFADYTYVSFTINESVTVNLNVYNVIGEVVYTSSQQDMAAGNHKLMIDTQDFTPGVYFVNMVIGDKVYTKKISSY